VAGATAVLVLVAGGCGDDDSATNPAPPSIVASINIWADVVANLACDGLADVETLIPTGGDPHAFEPSLADRGAMQEARLVVVNGLRLEAGLEDTIGAVEDSGTPVFRVGEHLDTIELGDDGADPHVWFDPVRVSEALPDLAAALVSDAGLDAALVAGCLEAYQGELASVDAEVTRILDAVPSDQRMLVTNHDSLAYFADRYGFEVVGTVIPAASTLAAANPADLERLAQLIDDLGVGAVFAETQHSRADADALAVRVGDVEVVTLLTGTLDEAGSGADTYLGLLLTDAELIAGALS
jgi:zinc/manganese transport system substrate-binding protein